MTADSSISTLPLGNRVTAGTESRPPGVRVQDIGELTAQMAEGQEEAYRRFYDLYFNRLARYLLVVTRGDEPPAYEALQRTFLRVVRHIRQFDSEEALWSWLTVLARSAVIDEQRKESRYRRLLRRFFAPSPASWTGQPEEVHVHWLGLLESQLRALDPDELDLIQRKYFAKQSVREIAVALASSEKAIESRLGRIRRRLKILILKGAKADERD